MTPTQREAALRLADVMDKCPMGAVDHEAAALLRELASEPQGEPAQPKLIGWRMADYTLETSDRQQAQNWANNVAVLPIFEGDPNTNLHVQPKQAKPPYADCGEAGHAEWRCGNASCLPKPTAAHPPQQRKPLTEEQILEIRKELVLSPNKYHSHYGWSIAFARLIEAAHGIKETP